MDSQRAHRWKPIEPPSDLHALASPELRAFEKLWSSEVKRLRTTGMYGAFWDRMVRRWSIETGIIERIYDVSQGATELLVQRGFDANLLQHGDTDIQPERLIAILEDHRAGLSMVMDLIGGRRELTVGWIKELHVLLYRHQNVVIAREMGPLGRLIDIEFRHGVYKSLPNNPTLDAGVHEYCPPEHVASEMDRLIDIYRQLPSTLPEVRAAWMHHAFVQIHPFQDGNGRVARALASIDFIRAGLFPLVVDRSQRDTRYMPALKVADEGDLRPLVEFFVECEAAAIRSGISEADITVAEQVSLRGIIQRARARVTQRRQTDREKRDEMVKRLRDLVKEAEEALGRSGRQLAREIPGVDAGTSISDATNDHYWRNQIVEIARAKNYFADLAEPRLWTRLRLEDGGVTDVVFVFHFVGNPSPGSGTAAAFVVHRDDKSASLTDAQTVFLPGDPLFLAAEEDVRSQQRRFSSWLDKTLLIALAEWQKTL